MVAVSSMERPHEMQRPVLGRDRAKVARNGCREGPLVAATRIRCASAKYFVWKYRRRDHRAASALKRLQTRRLEWDPYAGLTGAALVLLCEKPSPVPTVSRFESHAKGFNDIITMF